MTDQDTILAQYAEFQQQACDRKARCIALAEQEYTEYQLWFARVYDLDYDPVSDTMSLREQRGSDNV